MGSSVSQVFQSGSALLSNAHGHRVSDATRQKVHTVFDALRANAKVGVQRLEGLLQQIPKVITIFITTKILNYNELLTKLIFTTFISDDYNNCNTIILERKYFNDT